MHFLITCKQKFWWPLFIHYKLIDEHAHNDELLIDVNYSSQTIKLDTMMIGRINGANLLNKLSLFPSYRLLGSTKNHNRKIYSRPKNLRIFKRDFDS